MNKFLIGLFFIAIVLLVIDARYHYRPAVDYDDDDDDSHHHHPHVIPFKPNMSLTFDFEAGGSWIGYGTLVGASKNVDTGIISYFNMPDVKVAIDPPTQRFTFQDGISNFWYTKDAIFIYTIAFGQCYSAPGNYSAVMQAYRESSNNANPIQPAGAVTEYTGFIADPTICRIRNGIVMQQRSDGTVYQWNSDQLWGMKDLKSGKILTRLVSMTSYTFPHYKFGVNDTLFDLPDPCKTPVPAATYCDMFYWAYW